MRAGSCLHGMDEGGRGPHPVEEGRAGVEHLTRDGVQGGSTSHGEGRVGLKEIKNMGESNKRCVRCGGCNAGGAGSGGGARLGPYTRQ